MAVYSQEKKAASLVVGRGPGLPGELLGEKGECCRRRRSFVSLYLPLSSSAKKKKTKTKQRKNAKRLRLFRAQKKIRWTKNAAVEVRDDDDGGDCSSQRHLLQSSHELLLLRLKHSFSEKEESGE
jgi:hypothetical protein